MKKFFQTIQTFFFLDFIKIFFYLTTLKSVIIKFSPIYFVFFLNVDTKQSYEN